MIIASDIDGVLLDTEPPISRRISAEFGVPIGEVKKDTFYMHERFGIDFEAMNKFIQSDKCFGDSALWAEAEPFKQNIFALNEIFMRHKVVLITGRHQEVRAATVESLAQHNVRYDFLLMDAMHVKHKAMRFAGADLMIEDRFEEAKTIAGQGFRSYMIEREYNRRHRNEQIENLFWAPDIDAVIEMEQLY